MPRTGFMDIPYFLTDHLKGKTSESVLFIAPINAQRVEAKHLNINTQFFPVQISCNIYIILTFLQGITARCTPKYSSWAEENGFEIY